MQTAIFREYYTIVTLPAKFQGAMIKNGDLISGKFGSTQRAGFWPMCYLMARLKALEVKRSNCCISETVRARALKFFT